MKERDYGIPENFRYIGISLKSDTDIPVSDSVPVFSVYRYIEHP